MSMLGDPVRRETTASDLFRTVMNAILEEKIRNLGGKTPPLTVFAITFETMYISHTEPTLTVTTSITTTYNAANSAYDASEYT